LVTTVAGGATSSLRRCMISLMGRSSIAIQIPGARVRSRRVRIVIRRSRRHRAGTARTRERYADSLSIRNRTPPVVARH
jgi:hypothetical protein